MDIRLLPEAEREAFGKRVNDYGLNWLHDRTVCVCIKTKDGNPIAHGSGVLLQIADVGFLLSAGHVLVNTEQNPTDTVMIAPNAGAPALVPLVGVEIARTQDLEHADFGFARLPPQIREQLSTCKRFVRLSELALEETPSGECYSVMGFPREWAKLDPHEHVVSLTRLCYSTGLLRGDPAFSISTESIVLALGTSNTAFNDVASRLPNLRGMSGCGIWRMYGPESGTHLRSWSSDFIRLAGIEHSVVGSKAIKGVAIPYIVETIAATYPELRGPIDLAWETSAFDARPRIIRSRKSFRSKKRKR